MIFHYYYFQSLGGCARYGAIFNGNLSVLLVGNSLDLKIKITCCGACNTCILSYAAGGVI